MPRMSMREHLGSGPRASTLQEQLDLAVDIDKVTDEVTAPFESKYAPSEMRQLALVAHNHMKPAMKEFIQTYSEVLKKFRITGTQTTMRMCKTLWGEDNPDIEYGLTCTSGPLGGDAQIAALMCVEDLGAMIFFVDPLTAHPHHADIDSLMRLTNCGNVIVCANPSSAMSMMHTFKGALQKGNRGMIPSFFETLESPAVAEYKRQQEMALASAIAGKPVDNPVQDSAEFSEDSSDDEEDNDGYEKFMAKLAEHDSKKDSEVHVAQDGALPVRATRCSQLAGIGPKKKRGMIRKIGKSMKKMVI